MSDIPVVDTTPTNDVPVIPSEPATPPVPTLSLWPVVGLALVVLKIYINNFLESLKLDITETQTLVNSLSVAQIQSYVKKTSVPPACLVKKD